MIRTPGTSSSILDHIISEYGFRDKIKYRDFDSVNMKLEQLVSDGGTMLQMVTDFDYTLTKSHTVDRKCSPSADIIRQSHFMSDEFRLRAVNRFDKLLPVELDPYLTIEQKIPKVLASFQESFNDLVNMKVLNRKTLVQMIDNPGDRCVVQLRDNLESMLELLKDAQVPVLIFSAGFADIIECYLRKLNCYYSNIHVIGNFMEFADDEEQLLIGFKEPIIHTFNKNNSVIPLDSQYFDKRRANVVLLGDSIGDATMAQGLKNSNIVLKIGFLNVVDQEQLEIFLNTFDLVLLDDQTMDFVICLLKKIMHK